MKSVGTEENWQVEVGGQIYEAAFEELTEWIGEDSLLPQDKVRRGNLRWIEAQKVPGLRLFFDAKEKGIEPPKLPSTAKDKTEAANTSATVENSPKSEVEKVLPEDIDRESNAFDAHDFEPVNHLANKNVSAESHASKFTPTPIHLSVPPDAVCHVHADAAAEYLCETCGSTFCRACPKSFGSTVKICPFCGAMCKSFKQLREKENAVRKFENAAQESFGAADFTRALAHPFKFKPSLFFGALMFAFFTIGQTAATFGGFVMLGAALFCALGANMLTFGVLANTIEKFSSGNTDANFMPDFDNFSIWDDVVHPFFLSIAAYFVSFAPFILVCVVGVYLIFSSMTAQANAVQNEIAKVPGTPAFDSRRAVEQSEAVKRITENLRVQHERNIVQQNEMAAQEPFDQTNNIENQTNDEQANIEEMEQMIAESRKAQLESLAGKSPETERREFRQMLGGFLGLAAPLVVIGFFAFLWGMFYFPAACAVAGYTRSFVATVNPLVGLDTIRRLGFDYVKILLMGFVIVVAAGIGGMLTNIIFAPFELPQMGNIPATAVSSVLTFYFSIVFSAILGYALFKNSAKLDLPRN